MKLETTTKEKNFFRSNLEYNNNNNNNTTLEWDSGSHLPSPR